MKKSNYWQLRCNNSNQREVLKKGATLLMMGYKIPTLNSKCIMKLGTAHNKAKHRASSRIGSNVDSAVAATVKKNNSHSKMNVDVNCKLKDCLIDLLVVVVVVVARERC